MILGPDRQLAGTAILALPALLALTGLFAPERIGLIAFAITAAAAVIGLVAWRWLGDARALAEFIGRLGAGTMPMMPPVSTEAARAAARALSRLNDAMNAQARNHAALVASYEAMLESVPDPLLMLDERHHVVGTNLAARRLLERVPADLDIPALLRTPAVAEMIDRALAGDIVDAVESSMSQPVPRTLLVRSRRLPVEGINGARLALAVHDITALRQGEKMRAEFVANASHELRTPLASLLGCIETLSGAARDDAEARDRFLPLMHQVASRMATLVNDLLVLSRIEYEEHSRPTDAVDALAVASAVVAELQPQAQARGVDLRIAAENDLPAVLGQRDQVAQLVQNLVDNAIKYGGQAVEVSLGRTNGHVAVRVSDHGEGIAAEHIPRLTERFFRCDAGRSREMGGTGLGLAIVKHIVNRHRG
ncbi:MAG: ATP-binding protein, partial [Actinomycetota bacterium]